MEINYKKMYTTEKGLKGDAKNSNRRNMVWENLVVKRNGKYGQCVGNTFSKGMKYMNICKAGQWLWEFATY